MPAAALEVAGLAAGYGPTRVLDGVSFSIPAGARLAVLGRNGVGKTTLLATLAGQTRRIEGSIRLGTEDITPLATVSTHYTPDPARTRKLLLRAEEIRRLIGKVQQRGYALVPLDLHYSKGRIKLELGLARGKLKHDKRAAEREKDWQREKQQLLRRR